MVVYNFNQLRKLTGSVFHLLHQCSSPAVDNSIYCYHTSVLTVSTAAEAIAGAVLLLKTW